MDEMTVRRGDIFYTDFGDAEGSSMRGVRPALVVSNNVGNKTAPIVIVVAITTQIKAAYMPTHLIVEKDAGLPRKSMLLFEQMRTMDKSFLREKVGHVSREFMQRVDKALEASIGLDDRYNIIVTNTVSKEN